MKIWIFLSIFWISHGAQASSLPVERFEKWFSLIEHTLQSSKDPQIIAQELTRDLSRIATFHIQALAKIYKEQDEWFEKLQEDSKELEDIIGQYKKWSDILSAAEVHVSADKLNQLKSNKQKSMVLLIELLTAEDKKGRSWIAVPPRVSKIEHYRKKLLESHWGTEKEDFQFVVQRLILSAEKINSTEFDFSALEEGNGLHEFRRQLRWLTLRMQALDGVFVFTQDKICSNSNYAPLLTLPIAKSKYAQLPVNPKVKIYCPVSQCLFLGVSELVEQVGFVKDQVEKELNLMDGNGQDQTPANVVLQMQQIESLMKSQKLLPDLMKEFQQCL